MLSDERPEDHDDVDWDEVDREYAELLRDLYNGRLPTLVEFKRDIQLMMRERQQRVSKNQAGQFCS